jgi:4-phospho-D-threonate 3-dehydrogenase / 4-phospho-D-erythronate 3-dehydrogenase
MSQPPATREKPVVGITMGDPEGIGPEVVVKALADPGLWQSAKFVIYGQSDALAFAADLAGIDPYWFRVGAGSDRAAQPVAGSVIVHDYTDFGGGAARSMRQPTARGGLASKTFVEDALTDAMRPLGDARRLDAIVTAPISKEAWLLAGYRWPGHTELLAARTKARRHAMLFESPRLRVALATTHVPLMDVRNVLTIGRVFDPIDLGHEYCRQLGIESPVIAVTGLNPHAGENGLFGDEEERLIRPAIEVARRSGIDVHGPFSADTIFIDAAAGAYDLVVAMYHDQGLIPVKLLGWDKAVNVTVGLPIIRTSPDHGTAYDIAGQNKASEGSMRAAVDLAIRLARSPRTAGLVEAAEP